MAQQQATPCTMNKVVLLGDLDVGKTSLFMRFKENKFMEVSSQTRKEADAKKEWNVGGEEYCVSMQDCSNWST